MKVPASTIAEHKASYSASEPSTQWIAAGVQSSAILSIHRIRCVLVVSDCRGDVFDDLFMRCPDTRTVPGNDRMWHWGTSTAERWVPPSNPTISSITRRWTCGNRADDPSKLVSRPAYH